MRASSYSASLVGVSATSSSTCANRGRHLSLAFTDADGNVSVVDRNGGKATLLGWTTAKLPVVAKGA
jgi:hypothetical protein